MPIQISTRFAFSLDKLSDVLLQFEAAAIPEQRILARSTRITGAEHIARIAAQDGIGERVWLHVEGRCEVSYTGRTTIHRVLPDIATLARLEPHDLPAE